MHLGFSSTPWAVHRTHSACGQSPEPTSPSAQTTLKVRKGPARIVLQNNSFGFHLLSEDEVLSVQMFCETSGVYILNVKQQEQDFINVLFKVLFHMQQYLTLITENACILLVKDCSSSFPLLPHKTTRSQETINISLTLFWSLRIKHVLLCVQLT